MLIYFEIGPLHLAVETPMDFPWKPEVAVFRREALPAGAEPFFYSIEFTDHFQPIRGRIVSRDRQMLVMDAEGTECRVHFLPDCGEPFALTQRLDDRHYRIRIDSRARHALKWDRNLLGLMALEHDSLLHSAFLLHSSYVIDDGRAVLFSAPSGHGKSTQADLWAAHAGAEIVNGDRTLVFYRDGVWYAGGFPVCGSSDHCLDRTAPLKALIFLEKAPDNQALALTPLQAVKQFYSQAFINRWNRADCAAVSNLLIALSQQIPIFHYRCTKEADAVTFLRQRIASFPSESR